MKSVLKRSRQSFSIDSILAADHRPSVTTVSAASAGNHHAKLDSLADRDHLCQSGAATPQQASLLQPVLSLGTPENDHFTTSATATIATMNNYAHLQALNTYRALISALPTDHGNPLLGKQSYLLRVSQLTECFPVGESPVKTSITTKLALSRFSEPLTYRK